MVGISTSFPLKDTELLIKEKKRSDIITRKGEQQAVQLTLNMVVDISANYPLNKQVRQMRTRNLKQ